MDLAFDDAGSGGPPLLLLHLGLADRRMWDLAWPELTASRRAIRVDLPGYGASPAAKGSHKPTDALADLLTKRDARGACVVGPSIGGAVALDLALRRPDLVSSLVLVGASLPGFPEDDSLARQQEREGELVRAGRLDEAVEHDLAFWFDGAKRTPRQGPAREKARELLRHALAREAAGDQGEPTLTVDEATLREVRAPALVIVGEWDAPRFQAIADVLTLRLPASKKIVWARVAHYVGLDDALPFAREVLRFSARHP